MHGEYNFGFYCYSITPLGE